jgi:WD40 repeat protein
VADFGLAKQMDADTGHTQSGAIFGTPSYMAPEQASGVLRAVGPATDVYALGAILYEMLTGRPPLKGATMLDTLELVRSAEPVPPSRLQPKIPRDLETICQKCLEKAPSRRYASAEALAEDLRRYLAGEPIAARAVGTLGRWQRWCRRKPAAAALVLVLFLSLAAIASVGIWSYRSVREQLHESLYQQARALWLAREPGWREQSLTAVRQASRIRADARLRDQAVQALVSWDTRLQHELPLGEGAVASAMAVRPDRGELAVAAGRSIQLWDYRAGSLRGILPLEGQGSIWCVHYRGDGQRLIAAGEDGIHLLDLVTRKRLQHLRIDEAGAMQSASFGPGPGAVCATDGHDVFVWDQDSGHLLCRELLYIEPPPPAPAPKKMDKPGAHLDQPTPAVPPEANLWTIGFLPEETVAQAPSPPRSPPPPRSAIDRSTLPPPRPAPRPLLPPATIVAGVKTPFVIVATSLDPPLHWRFAGGKLVERQELELPTGDNLRMVLDVDEKSAFLACNNPMWRRIEPLPAPKKKTSQSRPTPLSPNQTELVKNLALTTICFETQVPASPGMTPGMPPQNRQPQPAPPSTDTGGAAGAAGSLFGGGAHQATPSQQQALTSPSASNVGGFEATGRATTDVGDLFGHRVTTDLSDLYGSKLPAHVFVFDIGKKHVIAQNAGTVGEIKSLSLGRNGLVMVGGAMGAVGLFRWSSPELERVAMWHGAARNLQAAALSKGTDADYLLLAGGKRPVSVWRVEGMDFGEYLLHRRDGRYLFYEDVKRENLAVVCSFSGIEIREAASGRKVEAPWLPCRRVNTLDWSGNEKQLLLINEFRADILDWSDGNICTKALPLDRPDFEALALAVSPDRKWAAVGGRNAPVIVCRAGHPDFQVHAVLGSSKETVLYLLFDHGSRMLAVVPSTGDAALWKTADWSPAGRLSVPPDVRVIPGAMAFSEDDRLIAAGTDDGNVLLWNLSSPAKPTVLDAGEEVWAMMFDSQGRHLVTGARNGAISLWDVARQRRLARWLGHDIGVAMVMFLPHEPEAFLTGSLDGEIRLWRLDRIRAALGEMGLGLVGLSPPGIRSAIDLTPDCELITLICSADRRPDSSIESTTGPCRETEGRFRLLPRRSASCPPASNRRCPQASLGLPSHQTYPPYQC